MGSAASKKAHSEIARQTAAVAAARMPATRASVPQHGAGTGTGTGKVMSMSVPQKHEDSSDNAKNKNRQSNSIDLNPDLVEFLKGAGPVSAKLNPSLSNKEKNPRIRKYDSSSDHQVAADVKKDSKQIPAENMMKEDQIAGLLYEIHKLQGSRIQQRQTQLSSSTIEKLNTINKTFNLSSHQVNDLYDDIGMPKIAGERIKLSDLESELVHENREANDRNTSRS